MRAEIQDLRFHDPQRRFCFQLHTHITLGHALVTVASKRQKGIDRGELQEYITEGHIADWERGLTPGMKQ